MSTLAAVVRASAALTAFFACPSSALAQLAGSTAGANPELSVDRRVAAPPTAAPATAATAQKPSRAGGASGLGGPTPSAVAEVVVTAHTTALAAGLTQPVGPAEYSLKKGDYADVLAGTSALALVKNLPGVTFTSTDAYGLDLSDGFLLVRGFRQNEVAVTFEGIPLNDGSYGSVTGTAPLNVGVTADIGSIQISPASAHVSTFSNSVDGGEVIYSLAEPKASPSPASKFSPA